MNGSFCKQFIAISACLCVASCGNVFVSVTYGEGSHYLASTAIAEALVERGHNVTYLISNAYEQRARHPIHSKLFRFEIFNHSVPLEKIYKRPSEIAARAFATDFNRELILTFDYWMKPLVDDCRAALSDDELMERLRSADFDIAIVDVTWGCSILLNAYLDIPTVLFNPLASQSFFSHMVGVPLFHAVVPEGGFGTPQKMNFQQRLLSLTMNVLQQYFIYGYCVGLTDPLRHEFGIAEDQTLTEYLESSVELVVSNSDPVIDIIMPKTSAIVEVGGLLTKPASPLKKDLNDYLNDADDGVIVLSLGTYIQVMPQRFNDLFAAVFARLPQRVVWQLPKDSPTKLSDNVRTIDWLPQNDLLGHPKTRLFIYQGGNNGLYEALYHGVPIIVLPVFADQHCVASRVTEKGMGQSIDIHSLTAEKLENAIKAVISNESYQQTAKRLSAAYRDRPETPARRAAFWVEHVMKHGGKYMRLPSDHLNFFQIYLVDVLLFLTVCLIAFIFVSFLVCWCIFRGCRWTCRFVLGNKKKKD